MATFSRCTYGIRFSSKSKYAHDPYFLQLKIFKKKSKTQSSTGKAESMKPAGTIRQSMNPNQFLQEESKIALMSTVN